MRESYFEPIIGQDRAIRLLLQAVKLQRIAPAYLFWGTPGVGRSLVAKAFIRCLLATNATPDKLALISQKLRSHNHPDVLWIEPTYKDKGELITASVALAQGIKRKTPPQIRIEQIRQITQFVTRPPLESSRLVVVIESASTMSEASANALLKTLEEPGKATLILIAPNPDSLLTTIVSRCQCIPLRPLSQTDLKLVLQKQGYREILDHPEIIAIAQGSPGKAIAAWQQLQTIPADLLKQVQNLPKNPLAVFELAKTIDRELDTISQIWLVDYLQHYYWQKYYDIALINQWEKTRQYLLSYVQPRLVWECTFNQLLSSTGITRSSGVSVW
ncbi:MAG TPA: DNA polymerase III subunit delta' [Xenococcaceae cyanobacterium]